MFPTRHRRWTCAAAALWCLTILAGCGSNTSASAGTDIKTLTKDNVDQLYAEAKKEGTLELASELNSDTAPVILKAFEKAYPGVKVKWTDASGEDFLGRLTAEAAGHHMSTDVFGVELETAKVLDQQGAILHWAPSTASDLPDALHGSDWYATDVKYDIIAWNTDHVSDSQAPRTYDDLANPKWKGRLIADPGDTRLLAALAVHKFNGDDAATEKYFKAVAANHVEFHDGHSALADLLASGGGDVCITCFSHHMKPRKQQGAHVDFSTAEGVGVISAQVVMAEAPHPAAALLWQTWAASPDGQKAWADAGAIPARPGLGDPSLKPKRSYLVDEAVIKDFPHYEDMWNEAFNLH